MPRAPSFTVKNRLWRHPGPGGWHFVTLGRELAEEVRFFENAKKVAWGYVKVEARLGKSKWSTTLFPTREKEYLLAVKASVRKQEGIREGDMVEVAFTLELEMPGAAPLAGKARRRPGGGPARSPRAP